VQTRLPQQLQGGCRETEGDIMQEVGDKQQGTPT
jgi:hypothetical protein